MVTIDSLLQAERLLQEHLSAEQVLKERLEGIQAIVAEGRTPSEACAQGLGGALQTHRDTYEAVRAAAEALAPGQGEGLSVQEYAGLFAQYKEKLTRREEAVRTLGRFLRVRAAGAEEQALAPFRKKAAAALKKLESGGTAGEDQWEPAALFLSALEMERLQSPEGEAVLERLMEVYPVQVYHGLIFKKYRLSEEEASEPEAPAPAAPEAQPAPPEPGKPAGELACARTPIKSGAVTPTVLKNELKQLPRARFVLPLLTCFGALTQAQIEALWDLSNLLSPQSGKKGQSIPFTLEKLCAKGLLTFYELDGTAAYCLTGYARGGMDKASLSDNKSVWLIAYGKVRLQGEAEMDAAVLRMFVENAGLLLSYYGWLQEELGDPKKFWALQRRSVWRDGHYEVLLPWADEMCACALRRDLEDCTGDAVALWDGDLPVYAEAPDGKRFCIRDGVLLRWADGRWIERGDAPAEAASPEPGEPAEDLPEDLPEAGEALPELAEEPLEAEGPAPAGEPREEAPEEEPAEAPLPGGPPPADAPGPWQPEEAADARALAQSLLERGLAPDECPEAFQELLDRLLQEDRAPDGGDQAADSIVQALVLSRALAVCLPAWRDGCERLAMAADSPIQDHAYTSGRISALFESEAGQAVPALKLTALLRALFAPDSPYDYDLFSHAKALFQNYEANFPGLSQLKSLYNLFLQINEPSVGGFTPQVLCSFTSEDERREALAQTTAQAGRLTVMPTIKTGLRQAMPPMLDRCFGPKSPLCECMAMIASGKTEGRELVEEEYLRFCDGGGALSSEKIYDCYKANWQWVADKVGAPKELDQRGKVMEHIRERLEVMGRWLRLTDRREQDQHLVTLRSRILTELDRSAPLLEEVPGLPVLRRGLDAIRRKLNGGIQEDPWAFADCLRTGVFPLDAAGLPDIDPAFASCRYYEPWRCALRHIAAPEQPLRDVLPRISDPGDVLYDNIGQAVSICNFLRHRGLEGYEAEQYSADRDSSRQTAEGLLETFKGELEQAFAYGRLSSESTKEEILEAADFAWRKFDKCEYYGCLRTLLETLRRIVSDETEERLQELQRDIDERMEKNKNPKLEPVLRMAREKLEEHERNFVVAEEYINRYDSGVADNLDAVLTPIDNPFLTFVEEMYGELYDLCGLNSSGSLRKFGVDYVEKVLRQRKVSSQYQESSSQLLRSMPNRPDEAAPGSIKKLLQELGFQAEGAEVVQAAAPGSTMVRLSVSVRPEAKDRAEYAHPVDIMGTKLRSPVEVVCFFGRMQPNDIVDRVCRLELSRTAVVFLNGPLDLPGRRQIAERFHREKSGQNPFLLVDWVLLLYLALHQRTERLPVLLSCALPYTSSFQPFVTSGSVPNEMFIGRKSELTKILDPKGPVVVYGGRQLGKTALLERAQSLAHHPERGEYAVLVRAAEYEGEADLVSAISGELEAAGLGVSHLETMRALCQVLRKGHREGQWAKLMIFIDEADHVLESFAAMKPPYKPVLPLSELCRDTGSDFKFVFAGLHDVLRAANDPNTVFGQFGAPLCIRPLRAADALELLSRPLRYLGFTIDPALIEPILVNTSFYPGIIHYVGYCLVENLSSSYANYYSPAHGNPPYNLTEKQLGEIINRSDLNDRINDRIRWTLEVDPRYFGLARCIAYLYCTCPEENKTGHSVDNILEYAELLGISCLEGLERPECRKLLEELVEMGILVEPLRDRFRLRQRRFQDAIGSSTEKIELDIQLAEKGEAHA